MLRQLVWPAPCDPGGVPAYVLLSSDVALVDGLTAMVLLLIMQYVVALVASRSRNVERLVKAEPTLLYRRGYLHAAMRART